MPATAPIPNTKPDSSPSCRNSRGAVSLESRGSHGTIELRAGSSSASISLWGGHLMSYRAGKPVEEVLWTGPYTTGPGRDCWGGIPLCWPWFMTGRGSEPLLPFHGPARHSLWTAVDQGSTPEGSARATLELRGPVKTSAGASIDLDAQLTVTLGDSLKLELEARNTSAESVEVEQCFHSYFRIGDVGRMRIEGLEATRCRDNRDPEAGEHAPAGAIRFEGPAARVFEPFPGAVRIVDDMLGRVIVLRAEGASHLVLWNSGPLREENGHATGEADWRTQLALEPLRGLDKAVSLVPGATLRLAMEITVEPAAD